MPHCPCADNLSLAERAECAAKRLKWGLVGLSVLLAVPLFVGHLSIASIVTYIIYMLVILVGIRGAVSRNRKALRFYWIVQFISLIVTLLALLVALGGLVYMLVQHRNAPQLPQQLPLGVVQPAQKSPIVLDMPMDIPEPDAPQAREMPKAAYASTLFPVHLTATAWVLIGVAVLWFFVTMTVKVRTIVLARQLGLYIESLENDAACDTELQAVQEDDVLKPAPTAQPQVYIVPAFVADGQLSPVYVAKQ